MLLFSTIISRVPHGQENQVNAKEGGLLDEFDCVGLDEYSTICEYLGLPKCLSKLFETENERCLNDLMNNWISNLTTNKSTVKYPIAVNELHPLPKEYIDLMNQVSQG